MESLVYFIISHSQMVIITLGGSIVLCAFGLFLIGFHHPQDAVANEVGNVDRIEGVLRQILSEQDWPSMKAPAGGLPMEPLVAADLAAAPVSVPVDPSSPPAPAAEVIPPVPNPAATPAPLDPLASVSVAPPAPASEAPAPPVAAPAPSAPVVAAASADGPAAPADVAPLKNKIKELEEKLAEYSVIEEDIADLSRFRQENDELKKKITRATGVSAEEAASMPWDDFEKIVKEKNVAPAKDTVATTIEKPVG